MIQLFKKRDDFDKRIENNLQNEIIQRAKIHNEATKNGNMDVLKKIDQILDKVSGYENSKITALTELYLALESGDTKELIQFLKKPDTKQVIKKRISKRQFIN